MCVAALQMSSDLKQSLHFVRFELLCSKLGKWMFINVASRGLLIPLV